MIRLKSLRDDPRRLFLTSSVFINCRIAATDFLRLRVRIEKMRSVLYSRVAKKAVAFMAAIAFFKAGGAI